MPEYGLPIESVLPDLQKALSKHACAVLQAPPGAGKTTLVPLSLIDSDWLAGRRIMMLAPRRLAARAAARRMANLLGEDVGQTVGYRVRMDSRVSAATRIEVVTEGVLTRMLQGDPSLEGVGLVIFDEFHERSLDADLGLALCCDMQGVLSPDLRLLVMSATIMAEPVAAMLGDAPVIDCPGREFPVETRYAGRHAPAASIDAIADAVLCAARTESGSLLVFLPGASEIRQTAKRLNAAELGPEWIVAPLFGSLPQQEQDRAISPAPQGKRKIVLATSIAETSLTIEDVRVVVDSGLSRIPRYDIRSGLTRLVTVPVSRASADQRRGRAGRTAPGVCIRLWSENVHQGLVAAHRPEILEADLASLVLELAIWGVDDPGTLNWLDPPPLHACESARGLLRSLGALDENGRVTEHGRQTAALPAHPRMAHMLLAAAEMGQQEIACDLAALLIERDPFRFDYGWQDVDMQLRIDLVTAVRRNIPFRCPGATIDESAVRWVIRTAAHLRRRFKNIAGNRKDASIGKLLALAYPDRIAQVRTGVRGHYILANGRGAYLDPAAPLSTESWLVAVELDGERRNSRIFKAAAYNLSLFKEQFAGQTETVDVVEWDAERKAVAARRELKFGALTLQSEPLAAPDAEQVQNVLMQGIRQAGIASLPWTKALRSWQKRVNFLRRLFAEEDEWPNVSDEGLEANLENWLAPYVSGMTRLRDITAKGLEIALSNLLAYPQRKRLDEFAPAHFAVPSGSRIPIDYSGEMPVLAVRLQEMFGLERTPTIAAGKHPLLIHLLSPAGRPVQITQDLAGFWKTGYPEVKKELKGRYPKHYWPDDPLQAEPTARVRPNR